MGSATALPQRSWIKRHAPWVIGIGALLMFAAFLTVIYVSAGTIFHDSDAYHMALSAAQENPVILENVGNPIETGRFVSGNMEDSGATGHTEFSVPISGPKGHGKLYVEARKSAGSWRLRVLQFVADGGQVPIDILPAPPAADLPR
jgi:hypothetical protein